VRRESMGKRRKERGQGLLEMAVVLPVLLILMLGVVEVGYALRNYLRVVNANREGARFAARGQFDDGQVGERVLVSGGTDAALSEHFLRTDIGGTDPNTGFIITHIEMDSAGDVIASRVWVSGVMPTEAGELRLIRDTDSVISMTSAAYSQLIARHEVSTESINATRAAADYERMENHIVVVETFFMHHPLWNNPLLPLPNPWLMHARTEMRVVTSRDG
jgi:hypothetical protein